MLRTLTIATALALALGGAPLGADWPQWRGPHGNGTADDKNLPDRWSAAENVLWRPAALPVRAARFQERGLLLRR